MKYLMLIAHGSRKPSANQEIEQLAGRIRELDAGAYDGVEIAFLEIAEPSIHEGISRCIEQGAEEIVVVPYFLASGNHVSRDIPGELECARAGSPGVRIRQSPYLGASDAMAQLVLDCSQAPA